jgi:hypothetical protein
LSAGTKSGYAFSTANITAQGGINVTYEVLANPANRGTTGQRSFCSDQSGVIRYDTAADFATCPVPTAANTLQ